jgi:hypothetical protein
MYPSVADLVDANAVLRLHPSCLWHLRASAASRFSPSVEEMSVSPLSSVANYLGSGT